MCLLIVSKGQAGKNWICRVQTVISDSAVTHIVSYRLVNKATHLCIDYSSGCFTALCSPQPLIPQGHQTEAPAHRVVPAASTKGCAATPKCSGAGTGTARWVSSRGDPC